MVMQIIELILLCQREREETANLATDKSANAKSRNDKRRPVVSSQLSPASE